MESALSPREIQTRIRSGESVADVARVAGVDHERVERFAAPVIAEREHVAGLAMTSSARRRGETSASRTLRQVLSERLLTRGTDIDTVTWDSRRLDDGRWAVTADYVVDGTEHRATFFFDVAGRYSVAGDDEGRWVLGDVAPARPPQPGESDDDTEPTIDLSDELALVRAIQDIPPATRQAPRETHVEVAYAEVVQLARTAPSTPAADEATGPEPTGAESSADVDPAELDHDDADEGSGLEILSDIFADQDDTAEPVELVVETIYAETVLGVTPADDTLGEPVAGDGGPSDASAVPELGPSLRSETWEPAIVIDYPVEPSEDDDDTDVEVPEGSDEPGRPEPPVAGQDRRDEADSLLDAVLFGQVIAPEPAADETPAESRQTDETRTDQTRTDETQTDEIASDEPGTRSKDTQPSVPAAAAAERVITEPEEQELPLDLPEQPAPATPPKPARRKRASVPSWDEIVFGGPKS